MFRSERNSFNPLSSLNGLNSLHPTDRNKPPHAQAGHGGGLLILFYPVRCAGSGFGPGGGNGQIELIQRAFYRNIDKNAIANGAYLRALAAALKAGRARGERAEACLLYTSRCV